ncbi:MAG: thioredoxin [Elusimicrobia bacterium RIFOXYA2_FULL_39_19]|nr:MAG: thioredoxin [Elusimicrobia bacterium RIFOXYA2_FULL_39_19]
MFRKVLLAGFILSFILIQGFPSIVHAAKKVKKQIKAKQETEVLVTFVELGSVGCMPCKMMQPVMKELEEEYSKKGLKIIFYDVWTKEGAPYAQQYKIRSIPTQVFLDKNGKEFFRHSGFYPKKEIVKILRKKGIK